MKTILFVATCMCLNFCCAQGNLQFNQVVTYTGTGSGSFSYSSPSWTVPAGKVWKVESASPNVANAAVTRAININAGSNWGSFALMTAAGQETSINPFPIWLKPGDQIRTVCSSDFASVIEFNVVP
jgi:hypothetical protein